MTGIMWFGLAIPGLLALFLLTFYRRETKWWELFIPALATVITIVICQAVAVHNATNETEYWGHLTQKAVHQEPFSYDSECSETYACGETCTGSGSSRSCTTIYCTRWVHCVRYSDRECVLIDDLGQEHHVSLQEYNNTQQLFQNFQYGQEVIKTSSHGYTTIGDKYKRPGHGKRHWVLWPQTWETSKPLVEQHTYENRLHTLSSWRNFKEGEAKEMGLFEYPQVNFHHTKTILGRNLPLADTYGQYINGKLNTLGAGYKKVRIWILIFTEKDRGLADEQEIYWKGGNKNEFVIMMNADKDGTLTWAHIMSPTEKDALKINVRDKLSLKNFVINDDNMLDFMKWLEIEIKNDYVKPDYRQYAYIEVVPSLTAVIISYIIMFVINVGAGIFVIKNQWHDRYNDELTLQGAAMNVRNASRSLLYEVAKSLGIIRLLDWGVRKKPVENPIETLTEGRMRGGLGRTYDLTQNNFRPMGGPPVPRVPGTKKLLKRKRRIN